MSLIAATLTLCVGLTQAEKPAASPIRIGVYDSRGIAVAYGRSAEFRQKVAKMRSDYEEAKSKGNDARVKELEKRGPWMDVRLHQQGFSTAGVTDIMAKVAGALPGIAREANVVLIASKWELPYSDPSIEIVDVTLPIAMLFKPDEETLQGLGELKDQKPVPFDEVPLEGGD